MRCLHHAFGNREQSELEVFGGYPSSQLSEARSKVRLCHTGCDTSYT